MKKSVALLLALFLALGFAGVASAHVTVQPSSVPAGSYQVFTLRVPSEEQSVKTTQVKVDVPAEVDVSRFEPKPGWTYTTETDADGKITSFTWKAEGEGLSPTEFIQFNFQGKVAPDAAELVWKARQTYSDGTVVDWSGGADADTPASVTTVTPAAADEHGHGGSTEASANERDPLTFGFAIAGLAAGIIALAISLVRRRRA
ncbi:YcnI family protein [Cohnella lubricantis]|uniref:YcnI family protein n=1 Tax=Cohnella lubricantis TaxID=2163172 RepID=A0A841TIP2_9BACL|nr:YcnI family protein [Cohnella lubricantis]MBB6678361.1 YcnI family protein [Cohnella lubricantis]MBP2116741.1 uncharacterized protein YcnI [Cohnella lubricantis]